jgi:protein involved in polysaccharide export with SLBB domain
MISTSIASAWSRRTSSTLVVSLVLALIAAPALGAQSSASLSARRGFASRADLEVAAATAERLARTSSDKKERDRKAREASMIRERLREGDFQPGHRIFLDVVSDSALSDTFTVRSDRKLLLPNLPEVSLVGVLDSELQDYLTKELSRYIKNPTVRATGLLRLSITGSVGRPGFYSLPMDAPVSDAIMLAGGPSGTADLHKVKVRRGDAVALEADVMDDALRQGYTLSDVGMRPGDELEVGDKTTGGWLTAGNIAKASLAAVFPLIWLFRRF